MMNATSDPKLESATPTGLSASILVNHRAYALGYTSSTPFGGSDLI